MLCWGIDVVSSGLSVMGMVGLSCLCMRGPAGRELGEQGLSLGLGLTQRCEGDACAGM